MAVISGTISDDHILGTDSADVLSGNAGEDTIAGLGGGDVLDPGLGRDLVTGGEGSDTVRAGGNWENYTVVAHQGGFVVSDKTTSSDNDEVFGVEFFAFANGVFSAAALPNLADAHIVSMAADRASWLEGDSAATAVTFTVSLDRPAVAALSVSWEATSMRSYSYDPDRTVFPGDLVGGSYPSGRLDFAPGELSKTVTVQVAGDTAVENDEKLTVYLRDPAGSPTVLGRESTATTMVLDDDSPGAGVPKVGIAAVDSVKGEGDAGATVFSFRVYLDAPAAVPQTARLEAAGDGANPATASDFAGGVLPSTTLTFLPGETSKTVTFEVSGDGAGETDEGFRVTLSSASAGLAVGRDGAARATILDDDMPSVVGTALDDVLVRTPGQDTYEGLGGRDVLDAGEFGYRRADVAVEPGGDVVLTHGGDRLALRGIEEVRFVDGRLVFDADDPAARVARLYEAALDRLPDQGGLNFWIDAVQQGGQPLSALAAGFLASPEFQSRFGGADASNGAFVDRLYQNVLGREGDAGGRGFWLGVLDSSAAGRADVLAAFSESGENKAGTAALVNAGIWDRNEAAAEVARLYDTVFGRLPDAPGLGFWKDALEGGRATLPQMAGALTASAEFQARYGELDNWDFADALYRNSLDRPPGYTEMMYWEDRLDAGFSRSSAVLAFSESAEHVALTSGNVQSESPAGFGVLLA